MKNFLAMLALVFILSSCSKDDDPQQLYVPTTKVIDKIEMKETINGTLFTKSTHFEYNTNKEISKMSYLINNDLFYSYTYTYQNDRPVSSMRYFPSAISTPYIINYGYTNNLYSSYYDSYMDDTTNFTYDPQYKFYTNSINGSRFLLNPDFDIITITANSGSNEYSYNYDTTKKGPLFNVVNKKWITALWYGVSNFSIVNISTYPALDLFDDNLAQPNPYTNIYDLDGFITKSNFTVNNGDQVYEITYSYKLI